MGGISRSVADTEDEFGIVRSAYGKQEGLESFYKLLETNYSIPMAIAILNSTPPSVSPILLHSLRISERHDRTYNLGQSFSDRVR